MRCRAEILARTLLMGFLVAPFAGCEEDVFPYRTGALYAVEPRLISHVACAQWSLPVPSPAYLAVGPDGCVVVAGGRMGAILGTNGVVQSRFAWADAAPASAVAVAADGRIFVGAGSRMFSGTGSNLTSVCDSLGEQAQITGVAASSNQLWICDAAQRVVWRFDFEGRLLGQLPPPGAPRSEAFVVPSPSFAVALAGGGGFWVVNPGRFQLRHHADDGRLLGQWDHPGMTVSCFSGCCNPAYLAVLPNGDLVTSEKKIPRIKIYSSEGVFRSVVVPPSSLTGDEGRPVAVAADGRVLVLDGKQIRVYARKTVVASEP